MDRDLQILVNTPQQLVVVNPPSFFGLFYAVIFGAALILAAFLTWKLFHRSRWLGFGVIALVLIFGVIAQSNFRTSHKLIIDRTSNTLTYQMLVPNDVVASKLLDLGTVKRADMDFNRTSRRIVLTLTDNQTIFPLGYGFDYEDSQFEVLDLIRQHISQNTGEEKSGKGP